MNVWKKQILIVNICLISCILTACLKTTPPQTATDIQFLCSLECSGRLPGSNGNMIAQNYIQTAFESCGLDPLKGFDSLLISYEQSVFNPYSQQQTLTAVFPNGDIRVFQSGKDFYPYLNSNGGFSGEVTFDPDDPELKNKILISEDNHNPECIATVLKSDMATASISKGYVPIFRCPVTLYEQILGCNFLSLEGVPITEDALVNNVAGVIRGENSKDALLITAHFDHVGSYGDVIYPGAYDNASGVALLLEVLRQISEFENSFAYDIVFIAFNGEDMGELGSKAMVDLLPYQTMNVINLDCIGLSGNCELGIIGENSELKAAVFDTLSNAFPCVDLEDSMVSDHTSFEFEGIPAITISSTELDSIKTFDLIHTPHDTVENVDAELLVNIAAQLCEYINGASLIKYTTPSEISTHVPEPSEEEIAAAKIQRTALYERAEEAIESVNPPYGYLLPIEVNGRAYFATDVSFLANATIAESSIPNLVFPDNLGNFELDRVSPLRSLDESHTDGDNRYVSVREIYIGESYELGKIQKITDYYDGNYMWNILFPPLTKELMNFHRFLMMST